MTKKRELIIDGLAGLSVEFSKEIFELRNELYDSKGIQIIHNNEQDLKNKIKKGNRLCELMTIRNEMWLAKLN